MDMNKGGINSGSIKRDNYIDICRGIGIVSVVVGHALNTDTFFDPQIDEIRKFLYIYHLAIFFWCSGYLYKPRKIKDFFRKVVSSYYIKYVIVCLVSLFFIPLWVKLGVYTSINFKTLLIRIARIFAFRMGGVYVSAIWFIAFLCLSYIIFYATRSLLEKYGQKALVLVDSFLGVLGIILVLNKKIEVYYINLALLMQPILGFGQYCRKNNDFLKKSRKIYWVPVTAVLIIVLNRFTGQEIELSKSMIYGGIGFYPMAFLGIIFVLSLAELIRTVCKGKVISNIGKNSFYIMSFHFMSFKLFDGIVGIIDSKVGGNTLLVFPISFPEYRLSYVLIGILLPYIVAVLYEYVWSFIKVGLGINKV